MKIKRPLAAAVGLSLLAPLMACQPQEPDPVKTQAATQWLIGQQQVDGGFEVANFPGFETPDAVLALGATAQTGAEWSPLAARQRVESVATISDENALDVVDDLVDGVAVPSVGASAQAAKIVALVAAPLGIEPTDFDPSNDSAMPVDLIARINQYAQPDGSLAYGASFNGVLYAAIALQTGGANVPSGLIDQISAAQRPDGSWNYAGNQDAATAGEVDTTSLALLALSTNDVPVVDDTVDAGVAYLAAEQDPAGSWSGNPNSTALAAMALSDLRVDVTTPQWRADYDNPVPSGTEYLSPYNWLGSQQAPDGHIASVNDQYGLNTFGTSQGIQALSFQWYLDFEHVAVSESLAYLLTSFGDDDPTPASVEITSDALGPNPSIGTARTRAAEAAATSQAGREAVVNDLFLLALGRSVDASGRAFYAQQLLTTDRPAVLVGLLSSPEYTNTHGPDGEFIDALYDTLFDRPADAGGRNYWLGRLGAGLSRAAVAQVFVAGVEYRSGAVADAYDLLLDRLPDSGELASGLNLLANGRIETLLAQLGGSQEYYDALGLLA